jgi:membrane protein implicated in regulation of membrane protease activity
MLRRAQSRGDSFLEAATNVAFGFVLALVTQAIVYPLFGIATTLTTDGTIAVIFTIVSLVRSYLVRRAFETFGHRTPEPRGSLHARP